MVYITDGSFEGCLTAVYDIFYAHDESGSICAAEDFKEDLLTATHWVATDAVKASKVAVAIDTKLGEECFKQVLNGFFSDLKGKETIILHFLRYAFKKGRLVLEHETHSAVRPMLDFAQKTSREAHRMLGLLRFMELESGVFYAPCEPTCFVLPHLASHFSKRLGDRPWVIHDLERGLAVFYDMQRWYMNPLMDMKALKLHEKEGFYQENWRIYFKSIAIEARKNPKLQSQMMPKKYWKHLSELK